MKKFFSLTLTLAAMLSAMAVSAQAADYSFETDGTPEYYPSSSYEDVYGSRYNYGGKNVVDYQIPELEYGQPSTTLPPPTPLQLLAMCALPMGKRRSSTSTSWMNAMPISLMVLTILGGMAAGQLPWLLWFPR